jgi:hypothetical protein
MFIPSCLDASSERFPASDKEPPAAGVCTLPLKRDGSHPQNERPRRQDNAYYPMCFAARPIICTGDDDDGCALTDNDPTRRVSLQLECACAASAEDRRSPGEPLVTIDACQRRFRAFACAVQQKPKSSRGTFVPVSS